MSPSTSIDFSSKYFITFSTAELIPFFNSLGLMLGFIALFSIAWANTVAVVVPSPASLTVWRAASFKSVAPMFSTGSKSVIVLATVTPSFVICGFPLESSNITHLPPAPKVELTAFVSLSIPLNTLFLASLPKLRCLTIESDMI